ncbi:hypothetical protein HNP47_002866 [Brevundimonas vesicularis]|uniref:Uncharacterized protein n=1 Tax=Brevundimonas vesicularis TaxID=41276 RepID=A0A7W9FWL5_BREVE|nr:hypothetical protein [Brevundimonas vesicularis]MBB5772846.1 hypothetical protein [Brevundimonas vesicularis]
MEAEYRRLKSVWQSGTCVREDALHLLYFVWMHGAEPRFLTGMEFDPDAEKLWGAIFEFFGREHSQDAEFLHVAAIMASLFDFNLCYEGEWERMKARSVQLQPEGYSPESFDGRGEYGEYFAHHARARRAKSVGSDRPSSGLRGWVVQAAERFFCLGRRKSH